MTPKHLVLLAVAAMMCVSVHALGAVKKIQITAKESPTFGGYSWPGVGQYEKIVGKAYGELDPNDPKNAVIVDLRLAPKNARGKVEYSFDFYILKPIDLGKGNHKMLYEPPNRGENDRRAQPWSGWKRPRLCDQCNASCQLVPYAAGLFDIVQWLGLLSGG
jgi:hypothetical protein